MTPGQRWKRIHLAVFTVMVALLPPTVTVWRNSTVYIVLMSWVAMAYAAISSWQASRVERMEEKRDE